MNTYLNGPELVTAYSRPPIRRADFVHLLEALERRLPGYSFCADPSNEGGIRFTYYPGYKRGPEDSVLLGLILTRKFGQLIPQVFSSVSKFIGGTDFGHFMLFGMDSPFKVMRIHGMDWPNVSGTLNYERRTWKNDHTVLFRKTQLTKVNQTVASCCLKAFRNTPSWSRKEIDAFGSALYEVFGFRSKGLPKGKFITEQMAKQLHYPTWKAHEHKLCMKQHSKRKR